MVNILLDQMGEGIQDHPAVDDFINDCLNGQIGLNEVDSIRLQIPRTIRAAYDIRNNRDSVHVNLRVPVNYADTQAGIAMCSWMLAEVLRVYGDGDHTDDMEEVGDLIEELSAPVSDGNPLTELETSRDDFDRQAVLEVLEGRVQVFGEDIRPGAEFEDLATDERIIVLMLGRLAATDLENIENQGASSGWYSEPADVSDTRVRQIANDLSFVSNSNQAGGYHIPGFRADEAIAYLEEE